jgi:hypothetical protein
MEAIAHSLSFAKKVHIPQSVGKDFAAADKGKTFKRGGDMKGYADGGMPMVNKGGKMVPSFAADGIGKMAKGGMASKMKMFEKSSKDIEKKGMKEGSKADMALDKKQMMKAGGKVRRMAAGGTGDPFELSDTDRENYARNGAENLKRIKGFFGFGDKEEAAPVESLRNTDRVAKPTEGATAASTAEVKPQKVSSIKTNDVQKPTFSGIGSFEDTYEPQRGTKTGSGASGFGQTPYKDSGFSAVTKTPVKRKPVGVEKVVKKERVITEPVDTSYSALEARRAAKKPEETKPESKSARKFGMASDETRASVRKGLGSFLDFFDLSKAHEREFGKKYAKGGNVKRMRYGGSPENGMDMGQPMRGMAPTPAPRGRGMPMPEAPRNGRGLAQLRQATELPPERAPFPIERMPYQEPEGQMPKMPDGEMVKTATATSAPRPEIGPRGIKAGGQVKKMAQGGYAKADGVASRGKTQPKMVKMAKGGFVKSADGCAQRGKTKAFQVKMNRGGMC